MSEWKVLAEHYHKRAVRMAELYMEEFKRSQELACKIDELEKRLLGETK